ncbi:sulfurtransferase TusA family protein [Kurthia zopfii]|uniref:sulfurtransferase TusA family protein n=1 Tax=Kurthia zopfii TaxID=1650 RepID=UPI000F6ED59B|nr:sulfurtransferase TusA family protein [Kurthia zopfii]VEI07206.1 Sulfurtransferase TusA [Kurthia zopfii]
MNIDLQLDAKGLACPMPIVRTKKAMDTLEAGQILEVTVTDKGSLADIPAWANASKNTILSQEVNGEEITFTIQKG